MDLYGRIDQDVKKALKDGNALKVSVLRMVISSIKSLQIEKNLKSVDDETSVKILRRHISQHRDSIEQFEKGNRSDLADKEKAELKILEEYIPQQMSQEELLALIKSVILETGASARSDMGKVMKSVTEKASGRADGKTISALVGALLK